jgi:5-methylcytosine-specific restriction endonuclease McrA
MMNKPSIAFSSAILCCFSRLINVCFFKGHPNEMLSSRAYRLAPFVPFWDMMEITINTIFFWEPHHCLTSYEWENNLTHNVTTTRTRSPKWRSIRHKHITSHPECAACGNMEDNHVHHIKPFHLFPELELEPTNLLTLCPTCHLVFGHFYNWLDYNPSVHNITTLYSQDKIYAQHHLEEVPPTN